MLHGLRCDDEIGSSGAKAFVIFCLLLFYASFVLVGFCFY